MIDLIKEIEGKKFQDGVQVIKSRLQKHFEGHDLDLISPLWKRIVNHIETTIHRVDIASKYFQIKNKTGSNNNNNNNNTRESYEKDPIADALKSLKLIDNE